MGSFSIFSGLVFRARTSGTSSSESMSLTSVGSAFGDALTGGGPDGPSCASSDARLARLVLRAAPFEVEGTGCVASIVLLGAGSSSDRST